MINSINNFDTLTLREYTLADIIKDRMGICFPIVLDPTLLYHGDFWRSKITDCSIIDGNPYILCYGVRKFTKDISILKKKAEELNVSNKYRIIDLNNDNSSAVNLSARARLRTGKSSLAARRSSSLTRALNL